MRGRTTSSVSLTPPTAGPLLQLLSRFSSTGNEGVYTAQRGGGGGSHRYPSVSQASMIPGSGLEREKGETDNELEKNRRCKRREKK